jgi:aerobic carbon-monoxide dehydrogenase small subunit
MTARTLTLTINGARRSVDVEPHRPLLDVLREDLDLTGTKECCAVGECGACTVLLDGRPVNSCLVLAGEADGRAVTTVEGLAPAGDRLSRLQEAFLECGAVQCGFCIPGMVVSAQYLLDTRPDPTVEDVREALSGNLCRCGGYNRIVAAVRSATGSVAVRSTTGSVAERTATGSVAERTATGSVAMSGEQVDQ